MTTTRCMELIKQHEGLRLQVYEDTVGKLTIGYGRNLDDIGITAQEAEYLLEHDVKHAINDAKALFHDFKQLGEVRQAVLINMAFNLGRSRLAGFRLFRQAVNEQDFVKAAQEMLNSKWAKQVGTRAYQLSRMMETGQWL